MPGSRTSLQRFIKVYLLPIVGLAGLCLLNSFLFRKIFGVGWRGYFDWYVSAGPFIGLALAAFGAAWESLDKNTGLVSANPLAYIGSCMQVAGLPIEALGGHLQKSDNYNRVNPWDVMAAIPMILLFAGAAVAWLLLIAPPQYFLFLICGAPSRLALSTEYRLRANLDGNALKSDELAPNEPEPTTGWDASMRNKPVTMANAFGAAVLFLVGYLISR